MKNSYCHLIFTSLLVFITFAVSAQVAINEDGSPPAASAMLDVNSASRGFLPPRLVLTAANVPDPVVTPAPGLLVYNTQTSGVAPDQVVPGYYSWNGSRWIPVSPPVGVNLGDMAYWNGTVWMIIPAGSYGQSLVFCNGVPTWGGCFALVSTDTVTGIVAGNALSGGMVTSDGGTVITARGVCWDTIPAPVVTGSHTTDGSGVGSFQSSLSGLIQNKTYHVRAYATNSRGVAYGTERTFTYSVPAPGLKP